MLLPVFPTPYRDKFKVFRLPNVLLLLWYKVTPKDLPDIECEIGLEPIPARAVFPEIVNQRFKER
ncbi:hypothetical protein FS842_002778 [Serendipita sp. 407]|nr:hypothetical protein FS842_002778 [Serendipita sp. 407]